MLARAWIDGYVDGSYLQSGKMGWANRESREDSALKEFKRKYFQNFSTFFDFFLSSLFPYTTWILQGVVNT